MFRDFANTMVSAACYVAIERLLRIMLAPLCVSICKTQEPVEARNISVDKMAQSLVKICYYVGSTYWNLQISLGKPWLPKSLGGLGSETHF